MIIIANIIAVLQKELKVYFASPLAYSVAGIFWLISGWFFVSILLGPAGIIQSVTMSEQLGYEVPPIDVAYEFLQAFFSGVMGSLSLFILPILSMGLYAEERKTGTLELLATSPLTNWVVALGKLLGALMFFISLIIPLFIYEIIVFRTAEPSLQIQVPLLAHLGLILLAGSILSLGMFISSLTESSIFSAIITFVLVLFLSAIDLIANSFSGEIGNIIRHFSLLTNYQNLVQGVLNTSSLVVFASYIFLGLFLTAQSIETLRYTRQ
jgi:ABC-2 type transport system permease protein